MHLPWCIGVCSLQKIASYSILCWEVLESNLLINLHEVPGRIQEGVISNVHAPVEAIKKIKARATRRKRSPR